MFRQLIVKTIDDSNNSEITSTAKQEIKELEKNEKELESQKLELRKREKINEIKIQAIDCWLKSLNHYIHKDTRVYYWVLKKYITKQFDSLSTIDCQKTIYEFDKKGINSKLGSIVLNSETLKKWAAEYKKEETKIYIEDEERIIRLEKQKRIEKVRLERVKILKAKAEKAKAEKKLKKKEKEEEKGSEYNASKKRIKIGNDEKSTLPKDWLKNPNTDKETKIEEYFKFFKSLNKAQKQIELRWFKKKIISKITKDEEEGEELVHELELIALED